MEPTVAEVNLRGREDAALNLCTFTDAAYFSYALSPDGSEPAVSEILRYVTALFRTAGGNPIRAEKRQSGDDFAYRCSAPAPALREWYILREEDESAGVKYGVKCNSLEQALARYEENDEWRAPLRYSATKRKIRSWRAASGCFSKAEKFRPAPWKRISPARSGIFCNTACG